MELLLLSKHNNILELFMSAESATFSAIAAQYSASM